MEKESRATPSPETGDRPWPRDYVGIAKAYAARAADPVNGETFGRWIRLAAQRFLKDLKRAEQEGGPFVFNEWHACDPCDFIEKLPHVEGTWDPKTIVLHDSDVFFVVNLFGFRNHDGTRRFTTAVKAVARKNAKSTTCAAIGLYCLSCEGELGPQVMSAATTGTQARIVFNFAKKMVERTPDLREAFGLEPFANAIASYGNGGTFKPINSKASTQDGLNPSCSILDEVHAHKTHDLLNVLKSAAGARQNPLFLYATTEGYESPGPWPELRHFAQQVLQGMIEADHFLVVYFAVDEDDSESGTKADDDFDESKWIKANPLMEVNPLLLKELRKEAIEAKQMPGRHAEFKTKRLNRASSVVGGWVVIPKWKLCGGAVDLEWLKQFPCFGGLDLASTRDLVSFRLVWLIDQIWYTHGWRYVPAQAVFGRSERGMVPYQNWVSSGHLIQSGREVTDYDAVEEQILWVKERFNLKMVGYDGWNAKQLVQKLVEANVPMQEFIQGPKTYHPAMQTLERAYIDGKLRHGGDPVLNWCAGNMVARKDANLNTAPDKKRAIDKIDDFCALLMGIGTALSEVAEPSYDLHFV